MYRGRMLFIKIIIIAMIVALVWRLYDMQIINGQGYRNLSDQRISANISEKAPRGEITDRDGKVLVTNRKGYSIKLQKTGIEDEEFNAMLLKLFGILDEDNFTITDNFPISLEKPYEFIFENDEEREKWFEEDKKVSENMTPSEVLKYYEKEYGISNNYTELDKRRLTGLIYDIKKSGFSINSSCVIANDVSATVVSKIKERQDEFEGVKVTQDYFRQYTMGNLAAHILGRIGNIYKEEYDELKDEGYGMNDLVGKQGIEKVCELYLKGTDGSKSIFYGKDAKLIGDETNVPAIPGNYVVLTIDSDLQRVAEESLAQNIARISAEGAGAEKKGADANAGAAAVIDVKTGEVLALATYPTYDPAMFNEKYSELAADETKPLWNRAISGTYTPGSTFKPLTAIAALSTGAISVNEPLRCDGVYTFYEDYQPKCWIWSEQRLTHGTLSVTKAIEESCNCFFYETGRRTGISALAEYAKKFGLSEKTGIELSEEVKGNVASPDYKKTLYKTEKDKQWVAGDTIQTAIGQSFSAFTPIALANYVATIANGGVRYKPHIIKSIHASSGGSVVYEQEPIVLENIQISEDILDAVRRGMLGVTDEGSARKIFGGYPISVAGKTGTAQISKKTSNNALFISFAPFDNPEIAVAVVIEHGFRGANAAYVARDIYDEYFGLNDTDNQVIENENMIYSELLP